MGFTIGGSRGMREIRPGSRRRGRSSECTTVAEFTGLWGWDVVPGARAAAGSCSCGRTDCPAPGAHPLDFAPVIPAGATLDQATEAWADFPGAAVMLPVGRAFDVIEVAEPAGRRALIRLERMGLPLGPVTATPRAAPTSSSPPAQRPNCPSSSTAWAGTGTTPPSTCTASATAHTSPPHPPTSPASARSTGSAPRPRLGDKAARGPTAAGDTGLRGAPVAGVAAQSEAPTPNCTLGAGASLITYQLR